MTKKLLLAAGAVAALAFAGAANAGSISQSSTVSGVQLTNGAAQAAYAPLTIASEVTDPTASAAMSTAASGVNLVNTLATAAAVSAGVTNTYEVIFTPTGGAFSGASTITGQGSAGVTFAVTNLGLRSDGTVAALVNATGGGAAGTVTSFTLSTGLTATSEADINVGVQVNLISNGVRIAVDSTAATPVVRFRPVLAASNTLTATSATVNAALPNYTSFRGANNTTATSANLATTIRLTPNAATSNAGGAFYTGLDLGGAQALPTATVGSIVTGGTLTVNGSAGGQLNRLSPRVGANAPVAASLTDTAAVFTLADNSDIETATGLTFSLTQSDPAVMLNAANYTASFVPTFAQGFTAPTAAYGPTAAGAIQLEGTNFTAPWFTLNNPNNSATLRLANNGTTATGPVFAMLRANNGSAAATNTRVTLAQSLQPGQVLEVTGSTMAAAFGTNAQNGDLQITIQGDGAVISGKVRVRNVSGATFEQSLGTLTGR